jgi:2-polyprenyl-3-methyl-5-hydroxy-6-metoxy-1,4-benzoquinol methylase
MLSRTEEVTPAAAPLHGLPMRLATNRRRPSSAGRPAGLAGRCPACVASKAMDPKDIVRRGYDALSYLYRGDTEEPEHYATWLTQLRERVPAGGAILDLGCGCGVPLARDLAASGYEVTGVDLSDVQVERARQLVPAASFLRADATQVELLPSSFDAVVSLYALIHMPLDEQPSLLGRIGRWLRPGGWFLATTGQRAWTGTEDGWLGGEAPMWWSHADAATYRAWIEQAGLSVVAQEVIPEGKGAHALFWARRPLDLSR